jgi:hypothetical protein
VIILESFGIRWLSRLSPFVVFALSALAIVPDPFRW